MLNNEYSSLIAVDSIALRVLDENAVLVAVGNELHLHTNDRNCTSTTARKALPDFRLHGKIHGIVRNAEKILVHGENEFILLHWTREYDFKLLCRAKLSDWISSATFLEDASSDFVLLTAHSVALRCGLLNGSCNIKEKSSCSDKSTLYCSHMHGNCWKDLVIFGGNAFGELLIWQPALNGNESKAQLLERVQMHNGVIFSIDYNEESQLLTTTSDDRSIKFWQINREISSTWFGTKFIHLASGFGHVARVFKNRIIRYDSQMYVITVGEDSYFCVWHCNGELLYKRRQQFGATIWNLDYDAATQVLYTVGSTGNLLAFSLADILRGEVDRVEILPALPNEPPEYIAKIKFLSKKMLIGMTNRNCLVYTELENASWQYIFPKNKYESYKCTVLEVHDNLIACCGYKRLTLIEYKPDETTFLMLCDMPLLNGVIRSFQFLKRDRFLISDEAGTCLLLTEHLRNRFPIELPKCKEPWLTTAVLINDELLLASNRHGNLLLYKFENDKYELTMNLKQQHSALGATVLKLVEFSKERALVQCAGHDGYLKLICANRSTGELQVYSRETVPVAWVDALIYEQSKMALLLGFNDNHFVIWSKTHDFACQVACGGGHRCWHYKIWKDASTNTFWLQLAFIKSKQVRLHRLKLFNKTQCSIRLPPPNTWHTKSCNVVELVPASVNTDTMLISAGDDNLIKIFSHNSESGRILQHAEVHSHISNVRALKVHKIDSQYCLIFSGGGRAQLCITRFDLYEFYVQQLLNYTLKPNGTENAVCGDSAINYSFDPETRIMAIDVQLSNNKLQSHQPHYDIYLGCSDGYVRKLHWQMDQLPEVQMELFYGHCVLQVRLLTPQLVAIAGTDGYIRLYDPQLRHMHLQLMHHASGVNAFDVLFSKAQQRLHLLSGGDDQAVVYSVVDLTTAPNVVNNVRLPHLHTAQVTAARLCMENNRLMSYTSGVDQQLCRMDLETMQLKNEFHLSVADIKGLCLDSCNRCFLYGCGLQIHQFPMETDN